MDALKKLSLSAIFLIGLYSISSAQMFTKITSGPHVTDGKGSRSVNFVDLNNDSYPDLYISNGKSGGENNMVYINNQDGTFSELLSGDIVSDNSSSDGASFADFNNDGNLDGFVGNWYNQNNFLYLNDDSQNLTHLSSQIPSNDNGYGESCSFSDIDLDGDLDLFVANSAGDKRNFLYINNGNGIFSKDSSSVITQDTDVSRCGVWADFDNDGDPDLFVANESGYPNRLYENLGGGIFSKITTGAIVTDMGNSWGASWGDYDNDSDLDLFVANNSSQLNFLYQNNGDKTFTKITTGDAIIAFSNSVSSSWIDYDNDGDKDLFVANGFGAANQTNLLYTNDGTGLLTKVTGEQVVTDQGWAYGSAWADYDKDGDLDLMVAKWLSETENNQFYRNDTGSANNWISIKCIGTQSNVTAVGAKVFIKATINGSSVWQMQEISTQHGYCSQNSLDVSFGLSDATLIDSLIIAWPNSESLIQTSVSVNQFLTIHENGVQIKADINFGEAPMQVQFDNLSGLSVDSYDWNFNDSFNSNESSPLHTFATPGLYDIGLTVTTIDSSYDALRSNYIAVYGDTISANSLNGSSGDTIRVPIELHNYLPLSSITIPMQFSGDFDLNVLELSNVGLITEFMDVSIVHFDGFNNRITFRLESLSDSLLPVGFNIIAEIVIEIPFSAPFGIAHVLLDDYGANFKETVSPYGTYVPISQNGTVTSSCCVGIRGNIDGDSEDNIDISDLVFLVAYMFQSGDEPICPEETDVDGSSELDISDLVSLVAYMFQGGDEPVVCI